MAVLLCEEIQSNHLDDLLFRFGLTVKRLSNDEDIPGSFWKPPEAGLIGHTLYVRNDTPVHSALHEACHYICMDEKRRMELDTNAGGDYEEEDGVCYLQILLADFIPELKQKRLFSDMDEWGYSFRLGSSKAWFKQDAEDAKLWLINNKIITLENIPTWRCRS